MRFSLMIAACTTFAPLAGCSGDGPTEARVPAVEMSASAIANKPVYRASLFINLHTVAPTTGARGTMANEYKRRSTTSCGSPGAVSEVTWEFLHHKDGLDVYDVTRRFPADLPNPSIETKEVPYDGTELVIFEDDVHRITMSPPPDGTDASAP